MRRGRSREARKESNKRKLSPDLPLSPAIPPNNCLRNGGPILVPWDAEVNPTRRPYLPQVKDQVIYFRQGHAEYVAKVRELSTEEAWVTVSWNVNEDELPYESDPYSLPAEVPLEILSLSYEEGSPEGTLRDSRAVLTCQRMTWEGRPFSRHDDPWTLKFHHLLHSVVDFLVLKDYYDGAHKEYRVGDRFRGLVEGEWWSGTVTSDDPYSPAFPDSFFKRYKVTWDTGEEDVLSPWDIEPLPLPALPPRGNPSPLSKRKKGKDGGTKATRKEILATLCYSPEWRDEITPGIERLFRYISLSDYASQFTTFPKRMNLNTIILRLENKYYRRVEAIKFDLDILLEALEGDGALYGEALRLRALCLSTLETPGALHPEDLERKWGEIAAAVKEDWRPKCFNILQNIYARKEAVSLRQGVDIEKWPEYYEIIQEPRFLDEIIDKFGDEVYPTKYEFHWDVLLVFKNAQKFYKKPAPTHYDALELENLYKRKVKKIMGF